MRSLAATHEILERRARLLGAVRSFFAAGGFMEVETPCLVDEPIPERFIDAPPVGDRYLAPSPEVHMKQLLAAGFDRIFQVSKCFRLGERGARHLPEFTMLEWYRTGADYRDLAADAHGLLKAAADALGLPEPASCRGNTVMLRGMPEFIAVDDAFRTHAGIELADEPDAFVFDAALVERVEPRLGLRRPAFLHDYPSCFCPMAKRTQERPARAERLELYIAGLEIANGCTEIADPALQERTLHAEQDARIRQGKDPYPWPAAFMNALRSLPPCAGMALGIDRLLMALTDTASIDGVVAFA
ncbi:EF-P lysine aminoacylase GenX [bacterium]|nr:EF-P lysine aminoacylase GenX [bacterium]